MIQNRQFRDELAELHGRIYAFLDLQAVLATRQSTRAKVSIHHKEIDPRMTLTTPPSSPVPVYEQNSGRGSAIADQTLAVQADDGSIPLWFDDSSGNKLFAWYHPPQIKNRRRQGIVLCNTFGSEAMLLHPTYRALAITLARAGYPCLRFDYLGTGDSSGNPNDPQLLKAWLDSIDCAIALIKARSGVQCIGLWGVLLGGTLAAWAAKDRTDIQSLVLWAPYLNGKSFLRSTKLQASAVTANVAQKRHRRWQEGDAEAFGFLLAKDFAHDLHTVDLKKITTIATQYACIFVKDSSASEIPLAAHWRALGLHVTLCEQVLCEMGELLLKLNIASDVIDSTLAFLEEADNPSQTQTDPGLHTETSTESMPIAQHWGRQDVPGCAWQETVELFGDQQKLLGIFTRPSSASNLNDIGIILVNGGKNHRVGINRNYTEWSRGWAAQGYSVLRFDIAGLGDSPPRDGEMRNTLYLDSTQKDLAEAHQYLTGIAGIKRIVFLGLCAGAYQSIRFALQTPGLTGLVLINPLRFQKPAAGDSGIDTLTSIKQLQLSIPVRAYLHFFLNPNQWLDLIRWRKKSLRLILCALRQMMVALNRFHSWLLNRPAYLDNAAAYRSIADDMVQLTQQNTHVLMLCSTNEVILHFLKVALGIKMDRLLKSGHFRFLEMENTDHILSPLWSQEEAFKSISDYLQELNHRRDPE